MNAAGYLDFAKRIDAVGSATFMRFETEGVATEHRWSNELQKSPFAKLVLAKRQGLTVASSPHGHNVACRV